jgi:hypothetical protein
MNELLQLAITNSQAKPYHGSYLIYPRRFLNSMVLAALLVQIKKEFELVKIMDVIKAIPKTNIK